MKTSTILYIIFGCVSTIVLTVLLILTIVKDWSWVYFLVLLSVTLTAWSVFLILKFTVLRKKDDTLEIISSMKPPIYEEKTKIKIDYITLAKKIVLDTFDDFLVNPREISGESVGSENEPKTPIFAIRGDGYWESDYYYFIAISKEDNSDYIAKKIKYKEDDDKEKIEEKEIKDRLAKHQKKLKTVKREKRDPVTGEIIGTEEVSEETEKEREERKEIEEKKEVEAI